MKKARVLQGKKIISKNVKKALTATGAMLNELASSLEWAAYAARHNRSMGWGEYEDMMERRRSYEERELLRALARSKMIETKRIGEKLMVRLTERGWKKALRDKIRTSAAVGSDELCVVIFDVPESERRVRDALRMILSDCGFTMIQKSVWATTKDVLNPLCALLQGSGLHKWIRIVTGKEVRHHFLKRTFHRVVTKLPPVKTSRS